MIYAIIFSGIFLKSRHGHMYANGTIHFPYRQRFFQCLKLHHELVIWETRKQFILTGTSNINYTTFPQKKSRIFFKDTKAVQAAL